MLHYVRIGVRLCALKSNVNRNDVLRTIGITLLPTIRRSMSSCDLPVKRRDDVFRLGADAELPAPEADAGGDIVAGRAPLVAAPRAFIDAVGNPGDRPYLSAVRMSAELEVDASLLSTVEIIGLMVEDDGICFAE